MIINIDVAYEIGQTVYLKTDMEQLPRICVCYMVDRKDVLYELMCGICLSKHYDFEIQEEKDVLA